MTNLHLCLDASFIDGTIKTFDKFYPGQNTYMILFTDKDNIGQSKVKTVQSNVIRFGNNKDEIKEWLMSILNSTIIDNLIIHSLHEQFFDFIPLIKQNIKGKVYWIFWGFELYTPLGEQGKYRLLDNQNIFRKSTWRTPTIYRGLYKRIMGFESSYRKLGNILSNIDYFCFWFKHDYELLIKNYNCKVAYKYFEYLTNSRWDFDKPVKTYGDKKTDNTIVINHSSSITGNHSTIIKHLKRLNGIEKYQIVVPISYGDHKNANRIEQECRRAFGSQFCPIRSYMPIDEYMNIICSAPCAIYGHLRQEAAGNIFTMLQNGVKVFMREQNPYFRYLKEIGYIVFSFENDLKSVNDLCELSKEIKDYNKATYQKNIIYTEDYMHSFFDN